jgi:glycosyltransferase involved in cell wall biosynthesis
MKVAIYTIALNEEQFVERWYESAKDADFLLIADTGSSDKTVEKAKALGINVVSINIKPWRFDWARNAAVAAIPADMDYCIALDMDEIILPGWREELEKALKDGVTRPRYQYTWSWKDKAETTPGLQYGGDKIHSRSGYIWRHPVHEVMRTYGGRQEIQGWYGLEIHHHPDNSKPRSQYLPLLGMAVEEDPDDDRNAFYYARELYFYGQLSQAANEFKRHLSLPRATWVPERAASMRYLAKIELENKEMWLKAAIKECPGRREPLVELSTYYYDNANWKKCYQYALEALAIVEKPLDYLCEEFAWGALPWDLAAISAYNLKDYKKALEYGEKAVNLEPSDERLISNLGYYRAAVSS